MIRNKLKKNGEQVPREQLLRTLGVELDKWLNVENSDTAFALLIYPKNQKLSQNTLPNSTNFISNIETESLITDLQEFIFRLKQTPKK